MIIVKRLNILARIDEQFEIATFNGEIIEEIKLTREEFEEYKYYRGFAHLKYYRGIKVTIYGQSNCEN